MPRAEADCDVIVVSALRPDTVDNGAPLAT